MVDKTDPTFESSPSPPREEPKDFLAISKEPLKGGSRYSPDPDRTGTRICDDPFKKSADVERLKDLSAGVSSTLIVPFVSMPPCEPTEMTTSSCLASLSASSSPPRLLSSIGCPAAISPPFTSTPAGCAPSWMSFPRFTSPLPVSAGISPSACGSVSDVRASRALSRVTESSSSLGMSSPGSYFLAASERWVSLFQVPKKIAGQFGNRAAGTPIYVELFCAQLFKRLTL